MQRWSLASRGLNTSSKDRVTKEHGTSDIMSPIEFLTEKRKKTFVMHKLFNQPLSVSNI